MNIYNINNIYDIPNGKIFIWKYILKDMIIYLTN